MKWEFSTVNRTAITLTFKPKFLEWEKQLPYNRDIEFTLEMLNRDKPIYPIPDCEDEEELGEWLIPMHDPMHEVMPSCRLLELSEVWDGFVSPP